MSEIPDLAQLRKPQELTDDAAQEAIIKMEVEQGLRCRGCGGRFEHGVACIRVFAVREGTKKIVTSKTIYCCGVCPASARLLETATAYREVRQVFPADYIGPPAETTPTPAPSPAPAPVPA